MDDHRPPPFLPDDVVAIVLRGLPPRALAVSRSVCKAWRAIIDERRMLRPDLLPLTLGGIFVSLALEPAPPVFFAPPPPAWKTTTTGRRPKIAGKLQSFVKMESPWDIPGIFCSCNGLLFLDDQVVNPATRQWAPVPLCPVGWDVYNQQGDVYFVFDPTLSPHYEVVYIQGPDGLDEESDWPPSTCPMWIYSSRTATWEETTFVREGGPAGTVAEERSAYSPDYLHTVCWHGALYVHYKNNFIMRISIPNTKYQVIKLPEGVSARQCFGLHLGKSKHGVYFASFSDPRCLLRVWFLVNDTEWVLKYDINLQSSLACFYQNKRDSSSIDKPWRILKDDDVYNGEEDGNCSEWDSDNDNSIVPETIEAGKDDDKCCCYYSNYVIMFGFHPFKEVVFLLISHERVVAFHLDTLKIQDLGQLHLPCRLDMMETAFVYTPCMAELPQHK